MKFKSVCVCVASELNRALLSSSLWRAHTEQLVSTILLEHHNLCARTANILAA